MTGKKIIGIVLAGLLAALLLAGCAQAGQPEPQAEIGAPGTLTVTFDFERQSGHASNQFAVWIEDTDGNLVKTLYATKFTAKGGYKNRPDSLAAWVARARGVTDFDAVAGATPKSGPLAYVWDLTGEDGGAAPAGTYRFFVEGTLRWKDYVLYTGEIGVGGAGAMTMGVRSSFSESPESGMIANVRAEYYS